MRLDEVIDSYHEALDEFSQRNPDAVRRLFSRRDDVMLAKPFGPAACGWADASRAMDYASSRFRDGEVVAFDEPR